MKDRYLPRVDFLEEEKVKLKGFLKLIVIGSYIALVFDWIRALNYFQEHDYSNAIVYLAEGVLNLLLIRLIKKRWKSGKMILIILRIINIALCLFNAAIALLFGSTGLLQNSGNAYVTSQFISALINVGFMVYFMKSKYVSLYFRENIVVSDEPDETEPDE